MKNLDVVITMAGLGSRFRKAGYDCPKYMIKAKGKTLFDWSMESLEGYSAIIKQYIFIALKDENYDVETFICNRCRALGIESYHVILIDKLTDGQATTATLAKDYWKSGEALLIYNIDTYVEPGEMNAEELKGDGFIPCFEGEGDHWSFVKLNESGEAIEVREKERISSYCTLGAYYFKSVDLYKKLYDGYYGKGEHMVNGEKYIAPLYNYLIGRGGSVYISNVKSEAVHVLGTPEELAIFLQE